MEKNSDNTQEPLIFIIDDNAPFERLDKSLAKFLPQHSRSRLQGWIEREHVLVNGQPGRIKMTVKPGDVLSVWEEQAPEETAFLPEDIAFDVVAESMSWIVVNKPVGLVVHPGAGNWGGTLLNGLLFRYPELGQVPRAGIVHRLDKDTSGLMVVARDLITQTDLVRQLQARSVTRVYKALVHGHVSEPGVVDAEIGRDPKVPVRMSCVRPIAPKLARTHFKPLRHGHYLGAPITELQCRLETGRTHQIRVHMAYLGYSLLGDELYGGRLLGQASRQMLHAQALMFDDHSQGVNVDFFAHEPQDMMTVVNEIEWE